MRTALLFLALAFAAAAGPAAGTAQGLWEAWPALRVSPADPWALRHSGLRAALADLQARHPGLITLVAEGRSCEGRSIPLLRVGTGPSGVLLWSQMHGDEPTATAALLDLLNWLGTRRADPVVQRILSDLTLWIIPMLNPDGTERTQRRNAQEIDINRDALRLASPEAQFLKAARERAQPAIGFNLHNQNPLLRAGRDGAQAALSVLSVPGDDADSLTPGTRRTRQLAVLTRRLADPFAPNRVARYDSEYTERAFGDSMTRWGTATLLVETGGWSGPEEAARLVRLNFVVLAGSLSALSDGSLDRIDPADYSQIPVNERDAMGTLVVRNVRLAGGRGWPPFRSDLSFIVPGPFAGDSSRRRAPALADLGDLSATLGLAEIDAQGMLAVPWPALEQAPDWAALKAAMVNRGLAVTRETALLGALRSQGDAALARPGYAGPVLFYRPEADGRLQLEAAVLRGRWVGEPRSPVPDPRQGR
jgi:hypothetical protein